MTLAEMEQELDLIVRDGSLTPYFKTWLNEALFILAADFDLPALRRITFYSFPVNQGNWIFTLPNDYHKNLFLCLDGNRNPVTICYRVEELMALDPEHLEAGERVTHTAVNDTGEDKELLVFPKADDTLKLWYYRKPNLLDLPTDSPRCLPPEFHHRVLIPKVVIKNYQLLLDLTANPPHQSLAYWEALYQRGLYGAPRGEIGLINYLAKAGGPPQRHGGRDPLP